MAFRFELVEGFAGWFGGLSQQLSVQVPLLHLRGTNHHLRLLNFSATRRLLQHQ